MNKIFEILKKSKNITDALGSFSLKVVSTVLGFLVIMLLARNLGADGFGTYAYVLAIVSLVAIPAQLGLPVLVVRETAKAQVESDWGKMKGLWKWSALLVLLISLIFTLVVFVLVNTYPEIISAKPDNTIYLGLMLVPLIAYGNLIGAAIRGLRRVMLGLMPEFVVRQTALLFLLSGYILFNRGQLNSEKSLAMYSIASVIAVLFGLILLKYIRPVQLNSSVKSRYEQKKWFSSVLPLAMISGMQMINQNTDIILLGYFCSKEVVGVYKVVLTGAATVAFGLQAVTLSVAPKFARLYAQGEREKLQSLVTQSARIVLCLSLPLVLLLVFFGEWILEVFFGDDYTSGGMALAILAIGQLINAFVGSVGILLSMTGHERDTATGVAVAAIVNIIFNLVLIPYYGMEGAAFSTALSVVVWNLILWRLVHKRLQLESMAFVLLWKKRKE